MGCKFFHGRNCYKYPIGTSTETDMRKVRRKNTKTAFSKFGVPRPCSKTSIFAYRKRQRKHQMISMQLHPGFNNREKMCYVEDLGKNFQKKFMKLGQKSSRYMVRNCSYTCLKPRPSGMKKILQLEGQLKSHEFV